MHLFHNVASTNEIALNIKLRDGWPVAKFFDTLADLLVRQHINVLILVDTVELEDLDDIVGESAPGHLLGALHKEHDIIVLDPFCELCVQCSIVQGFLGLWLEVRV